MPNKVTPELFSQLLFIIPNLFKQKLCRSLARMRSLGFPWQSRVRRSRKLNRKGGPHRAGKTVPLPREKRSRGRECSRDKRLSIFLEGVTASSGTIERKASRAPAANRDPLRHGSLAAREERAGEGAPPSRLLPARTMGTSAPREGWRGRVLRGVWLDAVHLYVGVYLSVWV